MLPHEKMSQAFPELISGSKLLVESNGHAVPDTASAEEIILTTCTIDCGGRCPLDVTLQDGTIEQIKAHIDGEIPPLHGCVRGYSHHHKAYAPDRLKYPLKRVGERGRGRYRRISWDEALDEVASQMLRVKEQHGANSIFEAAYNGGNGCVAHLTDWGGALYRLLNHFGGCTRFGTYTSQEGARWAASFMYGITNGNDSNSASDLINSKLIILWGHNPSETRFGSGTMYYFQQARKAGVRIVVIDPCKTMTVRALDAEWIPIRPSTDTAMLLAMAYVFINEDLYDKDFVDRLVFGFDEYKDYLMGKVDGVVKTPEWASKITGVPAETITQLARDYVGLKPAALIQGWSPGRTTNGSQYHRSAIALQALSGNIGLKGGGGSCEGLELIGMKHPAVAAWQKNSKLRQGGPGVEITNGTWAQAVLRGKAGGYPSDIKMIYVMGHNILVQRQNTIRGVKAFKKVEFVVCHEQFLTPTARYSDILLPATTNLERNDVAFPWGKGSYAIYANKIIDPMWDTKNDLDIINILAKKMGVDEYVQMTEEELLKEFFEGSALSEFTTYDELKEKGLVRWDPEEPKIAFKEEVEDPVKNPFPTPSGKIEIFSQKLENFDFNTDEHSGVTPNYKHLPLIPQFIENEDLPISPRAKNYPLQLITPHSKYRVHSQFVNIPRVAKHDNQGVWISEADAATRNIKNGDQIRVFNDRGAIIGTANVTDAIMRGVIRAYNGGWYDPDEDGTDRGGCVNVLINDDLTANDGVPNFNTCLVEITKDDKVRDVIRYR